MAIQNGTRLGPYEILAPIGAGGMGEVYRAKDTRLERTVAVKVLPERLSQSPDFKQRFEREARAISGLTHPNICTLHDVGHQEGVDYLVMELLEGESLAARLGRGALAIEQVVKIGMEIASALDRAHRSGVVHRDLKPGNIILTRAGAKLLDFGLAKGAAPGGGEPSAVTMTQPLTSAGMMIGTFQYMSPEQLEGKEADARSDIFALGAVMYEMATGRRAFEGKSQASLISAIMGRDPPPLSQVQPMTPPGLDRLVRACLAKDPEDRIQTAHDVLLQLRWIVEGGSQSGIQEPAIAAQRRRPSAWIAATSVLLAACILLTAMVLRRPEVERPVIRSCIPPPPEVRFETEGDLAGPVVVAPNGSAVAFSTLGAGGERRLWVRSLGSATATMLADTNGATLPFWSGDSRSIGFFTDGKLRKIDASGGPAFTICDAVGGRGGSWNRDGTIIFSPEFQKEIFQVSAAGGTPTPVTVLDKSKHTSHRWPAFCPDGRHFVYLAIAHGTDVENNAVYFASLTGGEPTLVMRANSNAAVAGNRLLFVRESTLLAAPFDEMRGRFGGEPAVLATDVVYSPATWLADFSSSQNGILAYHTGKDPESRRLLCLDRTGKELGRVGPPGHAESFRLSPDGKRVAVSARGSRNGIRVCEIARNVQSVLTITGDQSDVRPVWSPDGRSVAYTTIFLIAPRGTPQPNRIKRQPYMGGEAEVLYESSEQIWLTDWSRDGKYLAFSQGKYIGGRPSDIWVLPLTGERKPFVFLKTPFVEDSARFSPDGRWMAYESDESGRKEVYVTPFNPPVAANATGKPARGGRWQVSSGGGEKPIWREDGREMYYTGGSKATAVEVDGAGEIFEIKNTRTLFTANTDPDTDRFDVSADGQVFVIGPNSTEGSLPISLVINWPSALAK